MPLHPLEIVGTAGVALVLLAYFLLQRGSLGQRDYGYLGLNIAGSLLILLSLYYQWNLASFIIQVAWILISLYGMVSRWRERRHIKS